MKRASVIFCIFAGLLSFAQTGPGGVGGPSSNGLWLRVEDFTGPDGTAVTSWPDFSGNNNDANQSVVSRQPHYYSTSSLNGMPILRFDGTSDEMIVTDQPILDGTSGITYYSVLRPANLNGTTARAIVGKRVNLSTLTNYAYCWFFYTTNYIYNDINTQDNRYSSTMTFSNATNYLLSFDFDGSLSTAQRSRMFSGATNIVTATESATVLPNSNQDLVIGSMNLAYGSNFGGDIAELIHFNFSLDSADHIIVQNYLSAKYNIALATNNVYHQDDVVNGNFDWQVAGIGRINAANQNIDAQGSGIVRILNATDLNDNEFLMWGHDDGAMVAIESVDVPAGVVARFDRVWRVSESSPSGAAVDVGAIDIRWDLGQSGPVVASELRLLIDTNNDGLFADETPIAGAVSLGANIYEFSGVTAIADGVRFTLSTINSVTTPLPIELLFFTAENKGTTAVELHWQTASEINNDYFSVEKSKNGVTWQEMSRVPGAVNSSTTQNYKLRDENPYPGISYYRLRQTDFNGDFIFSSIESVELDNSEHPGMLVYPNPATDYIIAEAEFSEPGELKIYNVLGQDVTALVTMNRVTDSSIQLNIMDLSPGIYTLKSNESSARFYKE